MWRLFEYAAGEEMLAARLLCSVSFGLLVFAVGKLLSQAKVARPLLLATVVLILVVPKFNLLFWYALSEAPFLAVLFWAIWFALQLIEGRSGSTCWLALCVSLALLCLLRFTAAPFVIALIVYLYFARPPAQRGWNKRLTLLVLVASSPLLLWLAVSGGYSDNDSTRQLSYHGLQQTHWLHLVRTLSFWSGGLDGRLGLLGALALIVGSLVSSSRQQSHLVGICLFSILGYTLFLSLSISFVDAHTLVDVRILSPVLPMLLILAACQFQYLRWHWRGSGILLICALLLVPGFGRDLASSAKDGEGYSSTKLRRLEVVTTIASLPAEVPIYTNIGELFYLDARRETRQIPFYRNPITTIWNQSLSSEWEAVVEDLRANNGVVVWGQAGSFRTYLPTVEDMLGFGDLVISEELEGGVIMRLRPQAPASELRDSVKTH